MTSILKKQSHKLSINEDIMKFSQIIGHEKQMSHLVRSLESEKFVHAYIFNGPAGIGKKRIAHALMTAILCKASKTEPCESCSSCLKLKTDNHPDIMEIKPESGSVKNQQVEGFQRFVNIKPYESDHKIIIIEDADTMTVSAQNRILKVLEEPPSYVVIVMLTTNINRLLPTIRSRCLGMNFQPVPSEKIASFIVDNYNIDMPRAQVVANFSKGSFEAAIKMVESEAFNEDRMFIQDLFDALVRKKQLKLFDAISILEKNKEKTLELLELLTFWIRDMVLLAETSNPQLIVNQDKLEILKSHVEDMSIVQLYKSFKEVEKAKRAIREQVNLSANMESFMIALQEVRNG